jgi:DNA-binding CsgD family transcriptional regulator
VASEDGLLGRDRELSLVGAVMATLWHGSAATVLVEGEAGIGKTCLVRRIADDARSRGFAVFRGGAHPFERTRPFGAVASTFDLSQRSPDPRRAAVGRLLAGDLDTADPRVGPAPDLRYRVVEEILDLVETSSARQPVLVVVEDLQWADGSSLLAIRSIAHDLAHAAVLLIVTTRPAPHSAELVDLLDELAAGGARALPLRALLPDEVDALASRELGGAPGAALTAALAKASGNPLWVTAMLRALKDEGRLRRDGDRFEVTSTELPASLSELVVRRLRYLPPSTLELLQLTAVLGDSASILDVATVARRQPAEVVAQLSDAFEARLLDQDAATVAFRHQLVHDAVYQQLPASVRRLRHRDAAEALIEAGADLLRVSDHLIRGADRGDLQAVQWLRGAAREAAAGAPATSVELLRRAASLLPAGHRDADPLAFELVQALLRAGRAGEAADLATAALARPHAADVGTPMRLALLSALTLQHRAPELIAAAQAALAGPPSLRPVDRARVLAQEGWGRTLSGDLRAGEAVARRALAAAEQVGDAEMTVWALTTLSVAVKRQGRYAEALEHARRAVGLTSGPAGASARPLQPMLFLGLALFDADLVTEARAAYHDALDGEDSAWWLSDTLLAGAAAAFATGDWSDAVPGIVAGGQVALEKGDRLLYAHALAYRAVVATAKGDLRGAAELVGPLTGELERDPARYGAQFVAHAVATVAAAGGDLPGAYDVLLRSWRLDAGNENRYYHRRLGPDLVHLALTLNHREVAEEVADLTAVGAALAPEVPTVGSVALRCRGLVDDAIEPMLAAVDLARQVPRLFEHAGACEDAAHVLARSGRRAEAAELLGEALTRYDDAGADAWAGRVRAALRALGVRQGARGPRRRPDHGWESLTATERAVSHLVAEGLTNRAVARRLHLSPHTVNSHLRRVFDKLSVPNRVALATLVAHSIE